jgi:dihydroorotate dehydrogenase (NAD+) catalytic subunit
MRTMWPGMKHKFAGLKLKNPYISASGCWGYGWEGFDYFKNLKWGAVTTKTITIQPRQGNDPPRIYEAGTGIINRIGLQNCGLKSFLKEHIPRLTNLPCRIIVSIFGNEIKEWQTLIESLEEKKVDTGGWGNAEEAVKIYHQCVKRYDDSEHKKKRTFTI